ncbi:hypothetical protein MY494_07770 [Synechococcus sp. A10-1-5-1]|uniref:hypothetical protein n=1 Tax=Synechococcus sp. A10-1-5-1 TaxID=2936507 RepID=UPI002001389D|nr:hypothetical protein [Synechococcus sp. A10-1-5-1]UPM49248.1 hypothetical protein MY494_07770 [Synechococcus sp. A10-1-5-1]
MEQAAPDKALPLGLGLIVLVLVGSLWGCLGFISEWAGIEAGLPEELAHRLFRAIGFGTAGLTCALSIWTVYRIPSWRKQAAIGVILYLFLLWLTPRSFTYDTGLYHLPLINHLNQIGLEWNLGWLHSRYAFFNLLLYGQGALSRLAGTVALPSLNGLVLTGTLLVLAENVKKNHRVLVASVVVTGALLLPSESTESFHSFNADFSLGCIFLVCCILVSNNDAANRKLSLITTGISAFLPLIKVSGLFLLPVVLAGYLKRWDWQRLRSDIKTLVPLIALLTVITCGFGYITTGYLSYPLAQTGPLRAEAISKEATIKESKFSTMAWARFAYSDQVDAMKADASPGEWLPKWAQSLNGKRMLTYTAISLACSCIGWATAKQSRWTVLLTANTVFWIFSVLMLPPDPRFYFGPILLTLYGSTQWINVRGTNGVDLQKQPERVFITATLSILMFTSLWRISNISRNTFPEATLFYQDGSRGFYTPRYSRPISHPAAGACWELPAPCSP